MEKLSIPGVGGIVEKKINNEDFILVQDRWKDGYRNETGLIEIPAGKIREFESIFDCLRREIMEETGLKIIKIYGENECEIIEENGYKVLNYTPFSSSQNLHGNYPIMVQVFLCRVKGELLKVTNETKNIRWISLSELKKILENQKERFYPMHISTLNKYLRFKKLK